VTPSALCRKAASWRKNLHLCSKIDIFVLVVGEAIVGRPLFGTGTVPTVNKTSFESANSQVLQFKTRFTLGQLLFHSATSDKNYLRAATSEQNTFLSFELKRLDETIKN